MTDTSLTATAVREVADLATRAAFVQRFTNGKYEYADRSVERIDNDPELPKTLEFYTLDAFAGYLEREKPEDAFVHVVSPTRVDAISGAIGEDKHLRRCYASAICRTASLVGFSFNNPVTIEALSIALQTCFQPERGQIADLRKFCAAVRSTASVGVADDGVSQAVEAKRGIAAVQTTAVNNPWILAPWRTFAEVDQPVSPFVLRFREGETPMAGLFETGDGRWQVEAVRAIAGYLRNVVPTAVQVLG